MTDRNDDDPVGYKKPPKQHRFKKGRSGNPKGRPRAAQTTSEVIAKICSEKVTITLNGKQCRVSLVEAAVRKNINLCFNSSNPKYLDKLLITLERHGVQKLEDEGEKSRKAADAVIAKILDVFDRTVPEDSPELLDRIRREEEEFELIHSCDFCSTKLSARWKKESHAEGFLTTPVYDGIGKLNKTEKDED